MLIRLFILLLSVIFSYRGWALDQDLAKITIFNVGQGNAAVMIFPPTIEPGHGIRKASYAIVSDMGSCSAPGEGRATADMIQQEIRDHLTEGNPLEKYLYVIISHPDRDHFSFLKPILRGLNNVSNINFKVILGGDPTDYNQAHGEELKEFLQQRLPLGSKYAVDIGDDPTRDDPTKGLQAFFSPLPSHLELSFLHYKYHGSAGSKNSNSIVLKATAGPYSFLMPGDADGRTFDAIRRGGAIVVSPPASASSSASPATSSLIALASHHGADNEGCNSSDWIGHFKPEHVVISTSADHAGYQHPRRAVLERYAAGASNDPLVDDQGNSLEKGLTTYEGDGSNASKISLRKAIYSTADQGHISFAWGSQAGSLKISLQHLRGRKRERIADVDVDGPPIKKMGEKIGKAEKKTHANSLEKIQYTTTSIKLYHAHIGKNGRITYLASRLREVPRLRSLKLRLNEITPSRVKELIKSLSTEATLEKLDLGDNFLGDEGVEELLKLKSKISSLISLNLYMNELTDGSLEKLEEALRDGTLPCLQELNVHENVGEASRTNRFTEPAKNKLRVICTLRGIDLNI